MWRLLEVGEKINCDTDKSFVFNGDGCGLGALDYELDGTMIIKGKWPIFRKVSEQAEAIELSIG